MTDFYILQFKRFRQNYPWFETTEDTTYSDCLRCPKCNDPISMLRWNPPHEVVIKNPRRLGDFIFGSGGCDFLVSDRFLKLYMKHELTGIDEILPIDIIQMGTTKQSKDLKPPILHGIYLRRTLMKANPDEMGVVWSTKPGPDICEVCGKGRGGPTGSYWSRDRIVLFEDEWTGEDIFYLINEGDIILSEKAAMFISEYKFVNAEIVHIDDASFSYGSKIE